ncbi:hypothetical protein D052_3136 [Vibrio parahaemolyticus 10290]|nr:hypothetical protein D052_3136 [Vibrio parahaemolyticus 10290]
MLVALAMMGGTPTAIRAGKVIKLPPPAIEFMIPPTTPAANNRANSSSINNPCYVLIGY